MTWDEVHDKLSTISHYDDDWDGQGTEAPGRRLVETARQLANRLERDGKPPPLRVLVSDNGAICLEWERVGYYEEYEISEAGRADHWTLDHGTTAHQCVEISDDVG